MGQRQAAGVQGLAGHACGGRAAVERVSHQRMADVRHVHANLMGAARAQAGVDEAAWLMRRVAQQGESGQRGLACVLGQIDHGHALAVARIAAHGGLHHALGRALPRTMGQRKVFAAHLPGGDGGHQRIHRRAGFGHGHQAAGVFVQPVHDARARQTGKSRAVGQQAIEQRAAPVAGRRVNHQAGGFVQHEQVLVFMQHGQRHGLRGESLRLRRGAQREGQRLARLDAPGGFEGRAARQRDGALMDQLAEVAA